MPLLIRVLWLGLVLLPAGLTAMGAERINVYDRASLQKRQPILIAHRGGVVTTDAPECSLQALRLAAEHGYQMVELDIQETIDHIPVIFHDRDMKEACGLDKRIADFTVDEVTKIFLNQPEKTTPSDQPICTLEAALSLCEELNLGVMLDIKWEGSREWFNRIVDGIEKHGLGQSTVTITRYPLADEILKGKVMFRISFEDVLKVDYMQPVDVRGQFWFGWPRHITNDMVKEFQAKGALVIPSINVFHYPPETHMERARRDIERMKQAGVDAYQIDSVYEPFFKELFP